MAVIHSTFKNVFVATIERQPGFREVSVRVKNSCFNQVKFIVREAGLIC